MGQFLRRVGQSCEASGSVRFTFGLFSPGDGLQFYLGVQNNQHNYGSVVRTRKTENQHKKDVPKSFLNGTAAKLP